MIKWIRRILWILLILLGVAYVGASFYFARAIVKPNPMTLAQEEQWEKDHDMWGNVDQYQQVPYTVKGEGGYELHASLVKAEDPSSKKYVIITHGFRSNRNGAVKYVEVYRKLGYHTIIYDVRGHGENQPATVTLGNVESKDLLALIKDSYERYGKDIYLGLQGESMGSSISLSVLKYHPKVQFVVADCGFTNLYDLIETGYKANHLGLLMPGVSFVAKQVYGVDMKQTSAIDAVSKNTNIPVTFIHGEEDALIAATNSQKLAKANPSPDQVHLVKGAAHAESREVLGVDGYLKLVQTNPNVR